MGTFSDRQQKQYKTKSAKKWVGASLIVLGALLLIFCVIPNFVLGKAMLGVFGILAYPLFLMLILVGIALTMNLTYRKGTKQTVLVSVSCFALFCLLHAIFSANALGEMSFAEYLAYCYNQPKGVTVGGVVIGLFANIISVFLGGVGTCIFYAILLCVSVGLAIDNFIYNKNTDKLTYVNPNRYSEDLDNEGGNTYIAPEFLATKLNEDEEDATNTTEEAESYSPSYSPESENAKRILFGSAEDNDDEDDNEEKSARDILFGAKTSVPNVFESTNEERRAFLDTNYASSSDNTTSDDEDDEDYSLRANARETLFGNRQEENNEDSLDHNTAMDILGINRRNSYNEDDEEDEDEITSPAAFRTDLTQNIDNTPAFNRNRVLDENEEVEEPFGRNRRGETNRDLSSDSEDEEIVSRRPRASRVRAEQTEINQVANSRVPTRSVALDAKYNPPPTTLLKENKEDPTKFVRNYEENARRIEEKLETFRINAKVEHVVRGPTVTRYELSMPAGVPVNKILAYDKDLAMALMSKSGVRIEAPIPGKNAVGIELPNDPRSMVSFRELVESKEFSSSTKPLAIAIGKNISGEVIIKSLTKMVHMLIAGSTGSGKSVFLHSLIMSLMFKMSPQQLRFILIDPKRVEFSRYKGMPHMMLPDVVSDAQKAINSLTWAVKEMEHRYSLFEQYAVANIEGFNNSLAVKSGEQKAMPYIVIVVDELAELMMVAKKEVEEKIRRLTQLARACGIHLVLATQRPSVEVVTGTIKANLPTRIAFALTNFVDSKTILDEPGAEKLLGQGDMLFAPQDSNETTRLQAAYISDEEIEKCIRYIREHNDCDYDAEVEKEIYAAKEEPAQEQGKGGGNAEFVDHSDQMDPYLPRALKFFIESKKGSVNMIQRRFYVGYSRAARIVDQMELRGYVSPAEGSKNREILITMDEFREIFGDDV